MFQSQPFTFIQAEISDGRRMVVHINILQLGLLDFKADRCQLLAIPVIYSFEVQDVSV
jgi:hypothetical protein